MPPLLSLAARVLGVLVLALTAVGGPQPGRLADGALPYPSRSAYQIKGVQPDGWADKDGLAGKGIGGVAMNLVWAGWEPEPKAAPCGGGEQEFDGRCFRIDAHADAEIRDWSARGVVVTGVVYGAPAWARAGRACSPPEGGSDLFCAPDDPRDYG